MAGPRVGITGMGVVTAYGYGTEALWKGLVSGASAVRPHRARFGSIQWLDYPMAPLPESLDDLALRLPNQPLVQGEGLGKDRDLVAIAAAVGQAVADARLTIDPESNDIGLVVTHESPGLSDHLSGFFRWGEMARAWLRSSDRFHPPEFLYQQKKDSVYRMHSFLYIHFLAAMYQLHGFSLYSNNACASGAHALAVAADAIASGRSPAVVVVGGDVPEDGTKYRWFRDAGLYSASGVCRPFESGRDGLVLGSGAAAFVLEDLAAARRAGKRVYAEWLGAGFTSEGWKVTVPDVLRGFYTKAVARALAAAGVTADQISLLTPHGVGAPMLDRYEAVSLEPIFGRGDGPWPPLLAVKSALGHTLGGSVLVETVVSLLALDHGHIPDLVCCGDLDPALGIRPCADGALPASWTLLKCTNGFAGQNAAIVLRAADG